MTKRSIAPRVELMRLRLALFVGAVCVMTPVDWSEGHSFFVSLLGGVEFAVLMLAVFFALDWLSSRLLRRYASPRD